MTNNADNSNFYSFTPGSVRFGSAIGSPRCNIASTPRIVQAPGHRSGDIPVVGHRVAHARTQLRLSDRHQRSADARQILRSSSKWVHSSAHFLQFSQSNKSWAMFWKISERTIRDRKLASLDHEGSLDAEGMGDGAGDWRIDVEISLELLTRIISHRPTQARTASGTTSRSDGGPNAACVEAMQSLCTWPASRRAAIPRYHKELYGAMSPDAWSDFLTIWGQAIDLGEIHSVLGSTTSPHQQVRITRSA